MSGKIEVGCWAVLWKAYPCCGLRPDSFGIPFIVTVIEEVMGDCECGHSFTEIGIYDSSDDHHYPAQLCKRIDPPSESESQETKEELSV